MEVDQLYKVCQCGKVALPFIACTGAKCPACRDALHKLPVWCSLCGTFTHVAYGSYKL